MPGEKFIIDSDALITPYRSFYSFDFLPKFWSFAEQNIVAKNIMILDKVYDEIVDEGDALSNWLVNVINIEMVSSKDSTLITHYSDILNYINTSPLYKNEALNSWASNTSADAWLIAAALTHSYTVITFERPNAGLNDRQPSKDAKIPDICKQFNVKCENLYYMMRQLDFK